MDLCDAHWSALQRRCGPYAYAAVRAERGSAVRRATAARARFEPTAAARGRALTLLDLSADALD